MRFRELGSISQGTDAHPNQDISGWLNEFAWVFDGATMLRGGDRAQMVVVELVRSYDNTIRSAIKAGETSLQVIMHQALGSAFAGLRDELGFDLPNASGHICRLVGDQLHYLSLGDASLVVAGEGRLTVISDPDYAEMEQLDMIAAAESGLTRAEIVHRHRLAMNTPDGYWIWSLNEATVEHAHSGSILVAPGDQVLLASDGLMRIVDMFHALDHRGLVESIQQFGFAGVLNILRALEQGDPLCINFPRIKQMDDATGLLLKVEE